MHHRKSSCFDKSHDITSRATVSILLCQQLRLLLPSLKETPTLAYDGVRGIMPFPERIVINWIHRLLRVELAVTPSFVVSPSVAELKPCDKNDECRDKQCRQNARTDQQLLHLESFSSDLRPPRDQKESSPFLSAAHWMSLAYLDFGFVSSAIFFKSPSVTPAATAVPAVKRLRRNGREQIRE